ncbi:MAG TPA: DUF952 domain-containing protein [Anaerolineales bacterium]|nr:DUF952 domain-containing protein [Anaerolineales bacterium]
MNIYHITSRGAWIEATRAGRYQADSLESEGFIHCSTAGQVIPVAQQFYRGQTGLVLLVIDTQKLESPVRWEQSAPPPGIDKVAAFPHVYGPINLSAITASLDFEPDAAGEFKLPSLPEDRQVEPHA